MAFFDSPAKGNGLIVLPTGAGKSLVIANIAYRLDAPVLIFQPSKEILEQNYHKLLAYGVLDAGIFSASFNSKVVRKVTFRSSQAVNITDENLIPNNYIKVETKIDKESLKRDLKAGLVIEGAELVTNKNLQIR